MKRNNIASNDGETMICDTDGPVFSEFNIPGVEATIEEVSQPIDIDEEDASSEAAYR
jgi:hypothetical protein